MASEALGAADCRLLLCSFWHCLNPRSAATAGRDIFDIRQKFWGA